MAEHQYRTDTASISSTDSFYQSVNMDIQQQQQQVGEEPGPSTTSVYPRQRNPVLESPRTPDSETSADFPRVNLSDSLESDDRYIDIDSERNTVIEQSGGGDSGGGYGTRHLHAPPYGVRMRDGLRSGFTTSEEDNLEASFDDARNLQYEIVVKPENIIEAQRMVNNRLFGFRKWKSHVTSRPLSERSKVVKELYTDPQMTAKEQATSTISFGNVMYSILVGWWLALLYGIVGCLMFVTVVGRKHGHFCFMLAAYFFWPFGKFVHKISPGVDRRATSTLASLASDTDVAAGSSADEITPLVTSTEHVRLERKERADRTFSHASTGYWCRPSTYLWLLLACPLLTVAHALTFLLAWMSVVGIPVAKINGKVIRRVLLLPPELCRIDRSHRSSLEQSSDIIIYVQSAANLYYYKYTLDGVNVMCVNLLMLVPVAIGLGYGDQKNTIIAEEGKFALALIAITPLAYCIGMAITCLSAQTSFAVGAVINATFGSVVEIILYVTALVRNSKLTNSGSGGGGGGGCYAELVKAGLAGTLLAMTMLVPGVAMVVGGLRHRTLRFNARSAGVGATLLFVCVAGVFAPSIFARSFSQLKCRPCVNETSVVNASVIVGESLNQCMDCEYDEPTAAFYESSIRPLVYICMVLLPAAYIVGLVFSLKTHRAHIYDTFTADVGAGDNHHGAVLWGKVKSVAVLLVGITLMSVCADLVTENIQPILTKSNISVYFVGVTLMALVPDIPEIIIGIQFALQNQMSLSIEVGSCIAVQVCMLQVPVLVLADLIHPMGFMLIFTDVHIWSVLLGVLMMNYIYQDGKADYFQGAAMVISYFILIAMYFFIPNPTNMTC